MAWSGNDQVGEGRMTILESRPPELIRIKLEFKRPFESTCTTEFTFKPEGNQTAVTWTMDGQKKVNRAITGMVINRYVGDTGKKIFFTAPSTLGLERSAAGWEGSAVAVMPAS